jgi:transcriptional regulator with XRE-family HTH domain
MNLTKQQISWTAGLIRQLRGKRTQAEFGALIGVPKNTVWRWETSNAKPTADNANKLSAVADKEHFLKNWKLAGSGEIIGDLEEGSKIVRQMVRQSLLRSAQLLDD